MGRQENLLKSLELLRDLSLKSDSLRTIKHFCVKGGTDSELSWRKERATRKSKFLSAKSKFLSAALKRPQELFKRAFVLCRFLGR
jgi:hypothetical protein